MPETFEQYRNRLLELSKGQNPLKLQAAAPQRLARLLKGVPRAKLRKRPAPGKWSIHEIMTHLADTEIVLGFRIRLVLGSPGTPIMGFDQDAWVENCHYDKRDTSTALEQFTALRKSNLALFKAVRPEQRNHSGMHSERGEENVETMISMMAGHDLNHIAQIERILKPSKSR
jgi:hypothetical protein